MLSVRLPVKSKLSVVKFGVVKVICRFQLHRGLTFLTPTLFMGQLYLVLYSFSEQICFKHLLCISTLLGVKGTACVDPDIPHQRVNYVKHAFRALHLVDGTKFFFAVTEAQEIEVIGHVPNAKLSNITTIITMKQTTRGHEQLALSEGRRPPEKP